MNTAAANKRPACDGGQAGPAKEEGLAEEDAFGIGPAFQARLKIGGLAELGGRRRVEYKTLDFEHCALSWSGEG